MTPGQPPEPAPSSEKPGKALNHYSTELLRETHVNSSTFPSPLTISPPREPESFHTLCAVTSGGNEALELPLDRLPRRPLRMWAGGRET